MPKVLTKFEPPTPAEIMAFLRTGRWPKTAEQARAEHVAGVRDSVLAGTYETPAKLSLACERMLPEIVDKPNFADSISRENGAAHEEAEEIVREWDGGA